jgi:transposase-like protein
VLEKATNIFQNRFFEKLNYGEALMADYDIKLKQEDLLELLSSDNGMAEILTNVINQVLEAQCSEQLKAKPYERSEERRAYRNGYRTRTLFTRVGPLTLQVPQTRNGEFSTDIFTKYQRSEQAFVLGLMEMYVQGVSTRKVKKVTEALCGASFSKSTVSQLCTGLDPIISAWRNRDLSDKRYPFLIVDALVIDIRRDGAIRSSGMLIVYGVNEKGYREPLDYMVADSETEASWTELFKRLKARGLSQVDLVVSDAHAGLVSALKQQFQGAQWQRCQTHFMRNVLGACPRHLRKEVADRLKLIFTATDVDMARKLANQLIAEFDQKAANAMNTLEAGLDHALTILSFPARYRQRLRTTNLAERMNEEIRRRQRVIRIFPNEESAERLIGALLKEFYEEWQQGIRYLDMTEYWDWRKENPETFSNMKVLVA